jgi:dipeptidyl aminopeptidase/acylaminoacyl peptidase
VLTRYGVSRIYLIDLNKLAFTELDIPICNVGWEGLSRLSGDSFSLVGSTETSPASLYLLEIHPKLSLREIRSGRNDRLQESLVSRAEPITFKSEKNSSQVHGFFLPPQNPKYSAPTGALPPLLIYSHGGPTGHFHSGLMLSFQFYTSRGFAICLLNYQGSSGHGRDYRLALNGEWGLLDPEDAVTLVKGICATGRVDPSRVGIVGGSAGGYCVLQSICLYPDIYAGAVSNYGISNLKLLIEDTHKFESHYMDYLLFDKSDSDEDKEKILVARSPIYHAKNIRVPLLLLQGAEDHVVPLEQAKQMEREIQSRGGDVKLVIYPGEGHGFRKPENQRASMTEELNWWLKTLVR